MKLAGVVFTVTRRKSEVITMTCEAIASSRAQARASGLAAGVVLQLMVGGSLSASFGWRGNSEETREIVVTKRPARR